MRNRFDRSERISMLIKGLSNRLARQQGLIPVLGILAAIIGLIVLLFNVFIGAAALAFIGFLLQGGGIIIALVGFLIMEPLGQ